MTKSGLPFFFCMTCIGLFFCQWLHLLHICLAVYQNEPVRFQKEVSATPKKQHQQMPRKSKTDVYSVPIANAGFFSEFVVSETKTAFIKKKISPQRKHFNQIDLAKQALVGASNECAHVVDKPISEEGNGSAMEIPENDSPVADLSAEAAPTVSSVKRSRITLADILNPMQE